MAEMVDKPRAPTSSIWMRPVVENIRLVVIFDGIGHFGLCQSEVLDALFQQCLDITIDEKKQDDATFVDDYSRRVWVYTMKTKNEVLRAFLKWKMMMETQTSKRIKHLHTNNGGEYRNDPFVKICEDEPYDDFHPLGTVIKDCLDFLQGGWVIEARHIFREK
ncbi:hypothetical protein Golob_007417 [Gossypium lobatum]|uniref:Integrase catalytic domain-containing protein n=1 Tax=Gossypium lobatum TaxID=34289 RepID=A0A7J8MCM3_9ROSI|nr:hypothetical protein [Gossypium lobatum]